MVTWKAAWTIVVVSLLLVSGCLGAAPSTPRNADEDPRVPNGGPDSDQLRQAPDFNHATHAVPQAHTEGHGLSLLGHTSFAGFYPPEVQGGWTEPDVHGTLAAVASLDGALGVTLVDISDPTEPEPVSYIPSGGNDWDARFTDDGDYLFIGCQTSIQDPTTVTGDCRGNRPGDLDPRDPFQAVGISAWDVSDPAEPAFVAFEPASVHNVNTATINGTIYAFTSGGEILRFDPAAGPDDAFELVAEIPVFHDVTVAKHPVTGQWLLYAGEPDDPSINASFTIVDVTDPTSPMVLVEEGPPVMGWHDQAISTTMIDGRVLLVVGGELTLSHQAHPPFPISVIDVTDPTEPRHLSSWTLPVDEVPPYTGFRFSPHNIDISPDGRVAVAWYHAGVWVFDVSNRGLQGNPVTVGFYQPHEVYAPVAPSTVGITDVAVPYVWGPAWDDRGLLVVPDMYTGLYILESNARIPGVEGGSGSFRVLG